MTKILLGALMALLLAGCDAIDALKATKEMNQKMDYTNAQTGKVVNGVHLQALVIPINELAKAGTFEKLVPFPTVIALYAKPIAEEATARELMELTYLWLNDIDKVSPEPDYDREPTKDKDGKSVWVPSADVDLKRFNEQRREKNGRLVMLQAIAGFTPQATVDRIVREQVLSYGRFYSTALQFLMLRYTFIRDILLDNSLLAQNLDVIGEIEEVITYMNDLEYIARLPFAPLIAVKTSGIQEPYKNADSKIDVATVQALAKKWRTVRIKAESEMVLELRSLTGDARTDQALLDNAKYRHQRALALIDSRVQRWKR